MAFEGRGGPNREGEGGLLELIWYSHSLYESTHVVVYLSLRSPISCLVDGGKVEGVGQEGGGGRKMMDCISLSAFRLLSEEGFEQDRSLPVLTK